MRISDWSSDVCSSDLHRLQIRPRKAPRVLRDLFRCAFGHDFAALDAAFGAHVDDPVGGLDDVEIMFDHDDAVALLNKGVEDFQQFAAIHEMEAGGGLVKNVESVDRTRVVWGKSV